MFLSRLSDRIFHPRCAARWRAAAAASPPGSGSPSSAGSSSWWSWAAWSTPPSSSPSTTGWVQSLAEGRSGKDDISPQAFHEVLDEDMPGYAWYMTGAILGFILLVAANILLVYGSSKNNRSAHLISYRFILFNTHVYCSDTTSCRGWCCTC